MKIGFYSPYFDSLAGGERYVLTLAAHWAKHHTVFLFWDDPAVIRKATARFGLDLTGVKTVKNVFRTRNIFSKLYESRKYDCIFFLTDGSIPTTFAKYNILHVQVPFQNIRVHAVKLNRFQAVVCNSDFTKRHLDKALSKLSRVIYPPVSPVKKSGGRKKRIILSVGRFHPLKRQDVLVEAFRKGIGSSLKEYTLVLAGGILPADELYLKRLKTMSKVLPVDIIVDGSYEKLTDLYNSATIYWHGAGYRATSPQHMEHFGISTVEAMSAGAVPIVFNGGGLPEIVSDGETGFLWANTDQLLEKTSHVLSNPSVMASIAKNAQTRAHEFTVGVFTEAFDRLLETIVR